MNWDVIVTIGVAAVGAVWTLRSKLSDIQLAIERRLDDVDRRVVSLEDWRKAKGGRDR